MKYLLSTIFAMALGTAALAQTMTGTITGLPGQGPMTFSGTLTAACQTITAPNGTLTDASGATWSWGAQSGTSGQYGTLKNGVLFNNGYAATMSFTNSTIFAKTTWNGVAQWWQASGTSWVQTSAPAGC